MDSELVEAEISGGQALTLKNALVLRTEATGGEIHGNVTLPDGTPAPYVDVYADTGDYAAYADAHTNGDGNFILSDLADDVWIIYAVPPYGDKTYDSYTYSKRVEAEISEAQTLTLESSLVLGGEPTGEIHGNVALPGGDPVPYADVYANTGDDGDYASAGADENGDFILSDLTDGVWIIYAVPPYRDKAYNSYTDSEQVKKEITGGISTTLPEPLTLTPLTVTGWNGEIRGQIVLADETPVPYANVYADTSDYTDSAAVQTDENGEFALSNLADNTWIIYASAFKLDIF